jgi:integrase
MSELLKGMIPPERATVHGFRSSFRDWTAEQTNYPNHVAEMALAHVVKNKTEAAYRRGDLFDKRRRLMDEWSAYCCSTSRSVASHLPSHKARSAA